MLDATITAEKLQPGQIRFYDNFVPRLHEGNYTIEVSQKVSGATSDTFHARQAFAVNGPRFVLDGNAVQACYPPAAHVGRFEEQLPHIVLKRRALPWQRFLKQGDPDAPWMGVILLNAGDGARGTAVLAGGGVGSVALSDAGSGYEIAPKVSLQGGGGSGAQAYATVGADGAVAGIVVTRPGTGYSEPPTVKIGSTTDAISATVGDLLSPGRDATGAPIAAPALTLNPEFEKAVDPCQVIDIPTRVFSIVVPTYDPAAGKDELKFSAHVRQVDTGNKPTQGMKPADGWYSVLIAKRFPRAKNQAPTRQIAHLVSLEGFVGRMAGDPDWGGAAMVRLCSLASWTFTCLPDAGETFAQLMRDLTVDAGNTGYLLRPPYRQPDIALDDAAEDARQVLELGYLPMPYQTRQGEHTFAFYRGPLAPVVPPAFQDDPPLASPSEAVIYNPGWGIFDMSYAVAFQTGRLMALADRSFSATLLQWRIDAHKAANLLIGRSQPADLDALAEGTTEAAGRAGALLGTDAVSANAMAWLVGDVARRVAPKLSSAAAAKPALPQNFDADRVSDPGSLIADLQARLKSPGLQGLLRSLSGWDGVSGTFSNDRLQQMSEWLADLALFDKIPFNNLVPTAEMLPQGSIRFFYVDRNMIHALIDGALSVGVKNSRDALYSATMRRVIQEAVFSILHQTRQKVLGQTITPPTGVDKPITGFLLRSAVVSGWPGLEVKAFRPADGGSTRQDEQQIPLLRMTRLASDLLLVLFSDTPTRIELDEPSEGLAFGVEDGEPPVRAPVWVRHLIGTAVGSQFGDDPSTDAVDATPAIDAATGAIDLLHMRSLLTANKLLAEELQRKTYAPGELSPGDFALQMIKLPERMTFQAPR